MSDTATQIEKINLEEIDMDSLVAEEVELNPDANPMEKAPPVDDGTHRVKLTGATDWFPGHTNPKNGGDGQDFLKTKFTGTVVAEGTKNHGKKVFVNINTLTFDGKSEMGYILLQIKGGKNNQAARQFLAVKRSYVALAKEFQKALAAEPIIRVSTKWVAQYNAGTKEKPEYKTAKSGQKNFPPNGAGGYMPVINVPGAGEVSAQAEVQDYFPDAV